MGQPTAVTNAKGRCPVNQKNVELLNYISKNTEMGKSSIKQLLEVVKHPEFRETVESQYREYDEIYDLAHNALEARNEEAESVGPMAKISSYIMINVNNLKDGSESSMAEMMLKGSNSGIIEITKHLNDLGDEVEPDVKHLAQRLLKFEQRNVEELKKFL